MAYYRWIFIKIKWKNQTFLEYFFVFFSFAAEGFRTEKTGQQSPSRIKLPFFFRQRLDFLFSSAKLQFWIYLSSLVSAGN